LLAVRRYFKDIIYVATGVLVGTTVTTKFYWLWSFVVLYALKMAWGYVKPYLFPPPPEALTEAEVKRVSKKERQTEMRERRSKGK
jgi:hypothetical protein